MPSASITGSRSSAARRISRVSSSPGVESKPVCRMPGVRAARRAAPARSRASYSVVSTPAARERQRDRSPDDSAADDRDRAHLRRAASTSAAMTGELRIRLGMPLHAEREPQLGILERLGQLVVVGPAAHREAVADAVDALVVVRERAVLGLARRARGQRALARGAPDGRCRRRCPSAAPVVCRRARAGPGRACRRARRSSAACRGRRRAAGCRAPSPAARARSRTRRARCRGSSAAGCRSAPYVAGSTSRPPARISPSSASSSASGSAVSAASGGSIIAMPPARWTASL